VMYAIRVQAAAAALNQLVSNNAEIEQTKASNIRGRGHGSCLFASFPLAIPHK